MALNTGSYDSVLRANNAQYERVLGGYNDLLSGITGIGNAERQEITDTFAQAGGKATQKLINSGLGNTTVQSSILRGLTLDQAKAQGSLAEKIAGLRAGYQGKKLDFMAGQIRDPYPYLALENQQKGYGGYGGGGGGGYASHASQPAAPFSGSPMFGYGQIGDVWSGSGGYGGGGYALDGSWGGTSPGTGFGPPAGYSMYQTEEPGLATAGDWLTQGGAMAAGGAGYSFDPNANQGGFGSWEGNDSWYGGGSDGWF